MEKRHKELLLIIHCQLPDVSRIALEQILFQDEAYKDWTKKISRAELAVSRENNVCYEYLFDEDEFNSKILKLNNCKDELENIENEFDKQYEGELYSISIESWEMAFEYCRKEQEKLREEFHSFKEGILEVILWAYKEFSLENHGLFPAEI